MVIPLSLSSGALSIISKATASPVPSLVFKVLVIAAVRVVLPWSTWPMVPILQCGFVLSNLAFAIFNVPPLNLDHVLFYFGIFPDEKHLTCSHYISSMKYFQAEFNNSNDFVLFYLRKFTLHK